MPNPQQQPLPESSEPNMLYRGRVNAPMGTSDAEVDEFPEFEPYEGAIPRGPMDNQDYLVVQSIDLHEYQNKLDHQTSSFEYEGLIVRRGEVFAMTINFNRPYNPSTDDVVLEFSIGRNSHSDKNTHVALQLNDSSGWKWRCHVQPQGNAVGVGVTPAADCIVGKYCTYVTVGVSASRQRTPRDPKTDIYILFNAWCHEDSVFLDDEGQRQEYVLNDSGILFNGTSDNVASRPWNYGQHKRGVLDACFYVMNRSGIPLVNRSDVVKICRRASAIMNSQDDSGVLVGNWSGDYDMGTSPTSWTGSAQILLQYANTGTPVCFAQCWVFAAVLNSMFRCLGIPSRVVTNFNSAHDNNGNVMTDIFVDENMNMDRDMTRDSVWNYHCWVEAYMRRTDLPAGYNGWQVLDATPQETSDGLYRCGPTSVAAIKIGELCYPYDAPFVFAEVNSDIVFRRRPGWQGSAMVVRRDTTYIGSLILTKAVGSYSAQSITSTYKYPEGSAADAETMERATSFGCARDRSALPPDEVTIDIIAPAVQLGQNFNLKLVLKNIVAEHRTVELKLTSSVIHYTGVNSGDFKVEQHSVSLGPVMTDEVDVEILASDYLGLMVDQGSLSFNCVGKISENGLMVVATKVVRLETPLLSLKLDGEVRVGHDMSITMVFNNVFNLALGNVRLHMEGPGKMGFRQKRYDVIDPGASITWTESFTPEVAGPGTVVACLDSPNVRQVCGALDFQIQP